MIDSVSSVVKMVFIENKNCKQVTMHAKLFYSLMIRDLHWPDKIEKGISFRILLQ